MTLYPHQNEREPPAPSNDLDDVITFFEGPDDSNGEAPLDDDVLVPWRILIVDDDTDVHTMTRLVLGRFQFRGRTIELLSAYSGIQGLEMFRSETNIALAFIDVVMETEYAGLKLVQRVREELGNRTTRIILRTGQPGQAPEPQVVIDYDINDYKMKTDLTYQKLYSCTIAALRAYEYLVALEASRVGLRRIIEVTSVIFAHRTLPRFAAGVLDELVRMTGAADGALLCRRARPSDRPLCAPTNTDTIILAANAPRHRKSIGRSLATLNPTATIESAILQTLTTGVGCIGGNDHTVYFRTPGHQEIVVFLPCARPKGDDQNLLIEIFLNKIAIGIDSLDLWQQLGTAHKATVIALADMAEGRDTDTGEHVVRVATLSERIARRLMANGHYADQIDSLFLEQIGTASMLHDVGKVSIPDRILLKPGRFDTEERAIMETHAAAGGQMLAKAAAMVDDSGYLRLGQQIALYHHEWFDGTGYPHRLAGNAIPLAARIAALADVFDALCSERPYKDALPEAKALAHIRSLGGRQFDPLAVAALLDELGDPVDDASEGDGRSDGPGSVR